MRQAWSLLLVPTAQERAASLDVPSLETRKRFRQVPRSTLALRYVLTIQGLTQIYLIVFLQGLWIYARPVTDCKTADGEQITAVVIDSEGLNSVNENENHDLRVLTLSVLLSSKLIYNSMHAIDEQTLSQLNLVVNLTKHIQLRTSQPNQELQDPEELAKIFPSFLWLLRDFNLALVDQEGAAITPKEYLEFAL